MQKHTAGEWYTNEKGEIIGVQDSNHTVIAKTFNTRHNDPTGETQKANAELMALAPKMLITLMECQQALDHAIFRLKDDGQFSTSIALKRAEEQARMLIAKATK
jgi:hypothetical protein